MGTPVARKTAHRIRSGTQTVGNVTDSYAVTSLAVQSDQNDATPWELSGDGTTVPTPARISTNADLSQSDDGFYAFKWKFSYMTFGMVSHWLSQFGLTTARTALVTVMTYDATDTAVYLTCTIIKPTFPSDKAQYAIGGYMNVVWEFVGGEIIT